MKSITKGLMVSVLVGVISLLGYVTISYGGGPYYVSFDSVTMSPEVASEGTRVTFTIQVTNDGPRLSNVQILVVESTSSRREGRLLADYRRQVINRGVNTYRVRGIFRAPTSESGGVSIDFLDRSGGTLPAPVITGSGYIPLLPFGYKLGPLVRIF